MSTIKADLRETLDTVRSDLTQHPEVLEFSEIRFSAECRKRALRFFCKSIISTVFLF